MSEAEASVETTEVEGMTPRMYIRQGLRAAITACYGLNTPADQVHVEIPANVDHGDFATNVALTLARHVKIAPRTIADTIVQALTLEPGRVSTVEVAGPGFINFRLGTQWLTDILLDIEANDERFGISTIGQGKHIQVEFVSANPTGPLSVGHGRQAVVGDAISRLLEWTGHKVTREYYFNNAGNQMALLGESVYARYMEIIGQAYPFPEKGYHGDYIRELAQTIVDEHGNALAGSVAREGLNYFKNTAETLMFKAIRHTLSRMGIEFDVFYNESSLYESGRIQQVIDDLTKRGYTFEHEGALWFKATEFGLPQDRVIVRSKTGEPTYRLPDIAYHRHKFERGFDHIVDIFGADHIETYKEVGAGLQALGYDTNRITVILLQFVTLMRDGEQVRMSKRAANFVTLDELLDEVGADVTRFFILMRSHNSHMNFDLNLAKQESDENPVYYVQYAHARTVNVIRHAQEQGITQIPAQEADLSLSCTPEETTLIKTLGKLPEVIQDAATTYEPHRLTGYLREVASAFHPFYHRCRVVTDDRELTQSRLALVNATRIVLHNGLRVIGVSAPDKM